MQTGWLRSIFSGGPLLGLVMVVGACSVFQSETERAVNDARLEAREAMSREASAPGDAQWLEARIAAFPFDGGGPYAARVTCIDMGMEHRVPRADRAYGGFGGEFDDHTLHWFDRYYELCKEGHSSAAVWSALMEEKKEMRRHYQRVMYERRDDD